KYTYLKSVFIIIFMYTATMASAQSGVIYSFLFRIDPQLTNYIKVDDKSRTWLSGYSEGETMPKQLIDSIKMKTEEAFTNKLKMPVKMCFHKYKSDVHFESGGANGFLEGLPENTFKRGKEDCPQNSHYVSIAVETTKTKLKPKLQITAKVFDENKIKVWKKKITIKNFAKLHSETTYNGNEEITKSEVLSPFDIYAMYLMGLDELMKE
ncbi:MAG: hypothetical protein ABUL44_04700, partial [Flavobacterium sp.]